eukprot:m.54428 g.54428  ORF g.54428 m.54428 type:complete len:323 (+) comp10926_c0_seq1:53-1021(+)
MGSNVMGVYEATDEGKAWYQRYSELRAAGEDEEARQMRRVVMEETMAFKDSKDIPQPEAFLIKAGPLETIKDTKAKNKKRSQSERNLKAPARLEEMGNDGPRRQVACTAIDCGDLLRVCAESEGNSAVLVRARRCDPWVGKKEWRLDGTAEAEVFRRTTCSHIPSAQGYDLWQELHIRGNKAFVCVHAHLLRSNEHTGYQMLDPPLPITILFVMHQSFEYVHPKSQETLNSRVAAAFSHASTKEKVDRIFMRGIFGAGLDDNSEIQALRSMLASASRTNTINEICCVAPLSGFGRNRRFTAATLEATIRKATENGTHNISET